MGSIYRETYTKPVGDAELITKEGEQFARIKKAGKKLVVPVTKGKDGTLRLVITNSTYTAKYRDGEGIVQRVSTGCRDESAARSVLGQLERRAELVRSGVITSSEDSIADQQAIALDEHFAEFLNHLRAKEASRDHLQTTGRCLARFATDCEWRWLRDVTRQAVEKWISQRMADGTSAASINKHISSVVTFGNWCVDSKRLVVNPVSRIRKANEKADPRRRRRALTEVEVNRLVLVTRWRPIAEYGREVIKAASKAGKRSNWTRQPLTFDGLADAVQRGRDALRGNPEMIQRLDRQGHERALIVKTLVLTGLRKNELASLTVGQLTLDGPLPCLFLNAADEKNREGATIPLRADLADDLARWTTDNQDASRKLFQVPSQLVKILNRDLKAAGIPKRDERGRTVDVHALRHTFGTLLSTSGASPRTAQAAMRHSSIDLTMNTYTDPKLLDVQGAVEALPNLDLGESLVPLLVPKSVPECPKVPIPVISSIIADLCLASAKQGNSQGKSHDSQSLRVTAKSGRYRDRTCDPFRVK